MVSSISSTNILNSTNIQNNVQKEDVAKLAKYVKGEAIEQAPDTFSSNVKGSISSAALFEGIPLLFFLKNNKKLNNIANSAMKTLDSRNATALTNLLKGEGKLSERILNLLQTTTDSKRAFVDIKSATKATAKATKTAENLVKAGEKFTNKPNLFNKLSLKRAAGKAEKAAAKAAGVKITADVAQTTSKLGKFGKLMKSSGAGFMLVFSGIIEGLTEVVPTFKELGIQKGIKQLGKSAIKVVGDTAGFIGGECIGTALGTAAGAALAGTKLGATIGSVFPGFGTAIGAAVGCVCGMLGSFVMGKVTKAITGKSEREKAAEQQENQQLNELIKNKQSIDELKAEALLKLQEEAAQNGGELKGDALVAYAALQNLNKTNPYLTV